MANLGDLGGYWITTKKLDTKTMPYLLRIKFTVYKRNWDCQVPLSCYQTWSLKPKLSSKCRDWADCLVFCCFLSLSCVLLGVNAKSRCLQKLSPHSIFSSQTKSVSLDPNKWVFYITPILHFLFIWTRFLPVLSGLLKFTESVFAERFDIY